MSQSEERTAASKKNFNYALVNSQTSDMNPEFRQVGRCSRPSHLAPTSLPIAQSGGAPRV